MSAWEAVKFSILDLTLRFLAGSCSTQLGEPDEDLVWHRACHTFCANRGFPLKLKCFDSQETRWVNVGGCLGLSTHPSCP